MSSPQNPKAVLKDLTAIVASLIEKGLIDDQNFPALKQQSANAYEVTFGGAEYVSIALGDLDYSDLYSELADKRSYNVKFVDGGLLQLMYRFEGERLLQHRLAYYPSPILRPFQEDQDAYMRDELFVEIVSRRIIPFPLRFDFDDRDGIPIDVLHPRSHVSLGDVKGCRIPVTAPLTPRWFVEFVLRNFYQTNKFDFVSSLPVHRIQFESTITTNERKLIHISIPT